MDQLFLQPDDFAMFLESQPEDEQDKGVTRLLDELNEISNLNTRACYLSKYRKAVSKRLSAEAPILTKLRFPKSFWDERKGKLDGALSDKLESARLIDDVDGMIAIADKLLDSKNYHDLMIGLSFVTGRRLIETAKGTITSIHGTIDSDKVLFSGQVKTRGKEAEPYIIPILLPADRVLAAWKRLRQLKPKWAKMSNLAVTAQICVTLNKKTKLYFKSFGLSQFRDLRAVYSTICYERFAKNGPVQASKYASSILGHTPKDNVTGLYYQKFKIVSK